MSVSLQTPAVEIRDVGFRYPGHSEMLLDRISLTLTAGEVCVLVGPNGCGKTTLLRLILGELLPSCGSVRIFGKDPACCSRMPLVGLISEPFHPEQSPLPVDITLEQLLQWLYLLDGITDESVFPIMERLRIPKSFLGRIIDTFSRGERQRVLFLLVLARKPKLLLADEPMEGLDRHTREILGSVLSDYAREEGNTLLWISHHLAEAAPFATRLVEISNRRLVEHSSNKYEITLQTAKGRSLRVNVPTLMVLPTLVGKAMEQERESVTVSVTEQTPANL